MPELIDVMMHLPGSQPNFTVDTSGVDFVTVTNPALPVYVQNASGLNIFSAGDNFRLLSIGYIIPENFTIFGDSPIRFQITPYGTVSGLTYYNPIWSGTYQYLPMENFELVQDALFNCFDAYRTGFPAFNLTSENFKLSVSNLVGLRISMLGVPTSLNGKTFYIKPFIKILHTINLLP